MTRKIESAQELSAKHDDSIKASKDTST